MRTCAKCSESKELSEFPSYKKKNDTVCHRNECTICYCSRKQSYKSPASRRRDKERRKELKEEDPEAYLEKQRILNKRHYDRHKEDPLFMLSLRFRRQCQRDVRNIRPNKYMHLSGCIGKCMTKWIEYSFESDMNWGNYSTVWHIDHVVPITFFNLENEAEVNICFNWTNVRPAYKKKNKEKYNEVIPSYSKKHIDNLQSFLDENPEYQVNAETCWWRRVQLRYGKNLIDEDLLTEEVMKSVIRN